MGDSRSRLRAVAGRTATFVKERPRSQQLLGGGLAVALVTAPFGGLQAVSFEHEVGALRAEDPVRVGPFDVTVTKVRSITDLAPSYEPEGARVFAVVVEVENITDAPVSRYLLTQAVQRPENARLARGMVAPDDVFDIVDGTSVDAGEPLNPGLVQTLVLVWPQDPAWSGGAVTLAFDELAWDDVSANDHLSAPEWRETGQVAYRGSFDVEPQR